MDVVSLLKSFKLENIANAGDLTTRSIEERLHKENKLKDINLADFRPIEIQKKISTILNSGETSSEKRKQLLKDASENSRSWGASAGFSLFGIGGRGSYSEGLKNVLENETASDTDLASFANRYFAVEYDEKELKYRGAQLFDVSQLEAFDKNEIATATLQPELVKGFKEIRTRPSAQEIDLKFEEKYDSIARVPIGGVISWFGNWNDERHRPFGYELCDGRSVSTAGAVLKGRKPDLRQRFILGVDSATVGDVTDNVIQGGVDKIAERQVNTGGVPLGLTHLPAVDIPVNTTYSGGGDMIVAKKAGGAAEGLIISGQGVSLSIGRVDGSHLVSGRHSPVRVNVTGTASGKLMGNSNPHSHPVLLPEETNIPPYTGLHYLIRVR